MRNIRLILEYDGASFSGFQKQPDRPSIQEALEQALSRFFGKAMKIQAASGRTDAGAHAACQVVNFKTESGRPLEQIQRGLNALLPPAIAVKEIAEAPKTFHARYSARSKTYEYGIWNHPIRSPLLAAKTYHVPQQLNLAKMRKASKFLLGRQDFKSFCASGSKAGEKGDTVRTIYRLELKREGSLLTFRIRADGFLYRMVRNIVGTLLEVGEGKYSLPEFKEIVRAGNRSQAGRTVPSKALTLVETSYRNLPARSRS